MALARPAGRSIAIALAMTVHTSFGTVLIWQALRRAREVLSIVAIAATFLPFLARDPAPDGLTDHSAPQLLSKNERLPPQPATV